MSNAEETFQGWSNHKTWHRALIIDNDQELYNYFYKFAHKLLKDGVEPLEVQRLTFRRIMDKFGRERGVNRMEIAAEIVRTVKEEWE